MADNPRLKSLEDAVERLGGVLSLPMDPIVRDSGIKRFELCFELSWKVIQSFLRDRGLDCHSPRDCFREELANQLYARLPRYLPAFRQLWGKLQPSEK